MFIRCGPLTLQREPCTRSEGQHETARLALLRRAGHWSTAGALLLAHLAVHAAEPSNPVPVDELKQRLTEQSRQLEALKRQLATQQSQLEELRKSIEAQEHTEPARTPVAAEAPPKAALPESSPPQVATIFQQPGVLTPRGKTIVEPSLQYSYSSSSSVAIVGYTVIPAILVGLIDVRDVKATTVTAAMAVRFGLTERAEIEAKVPYEYRYDTSISQAALGGSNNDSAIFNANGKGIGDVEFTGRYQFNDGGQDKAYYLGSLRVKTRTGRDPFEIPISSSVSGFSGQGLQSQLPMGSGFYGIQPALTMLYPSDPAVFFGSVSALYSPARHNVVRQTDQGPQTLGTLSPGVIFGFNFGMGIALNERSSFSLGYDHSSIGKTLQNGAVAPDSVRLQLGTLLFGLSYRLDERHTLNVSLGAGLTRDTPDVTLTVRLPTSF